MTTWTTASAAAELLAAERGRRDRGPLSEEWPELDVALGYAIQDEVLRHKQEAGERVVGVKLGLTSRAKQQRMGISSPLTAWLTDAMLMAPGTPVPMDQLIHPRAEPEIVFVLGRPLHGPGVTPAVAMAAVESVVGGIEIIDSRYKDFRFTLPDVIADNASSAAFAVGGVAVSPVGLDLTLEAALLQVGGRVVDTATGAEVQGHPGAALALAANSLGERGLGLEAGWLVLTGGMTDAVFVERDVGIAAHFTSLGSIWLPRN